MIKCNFTKLMKGNKLFLKESVLGQRVMLLLFPFFTFFTLKLDSISYSYTSENGQFYLTFIVLLYTFILFCFAGLQLKKMIIMMIFLSYIGELIFCKLLGWYTYRLNNIPFYVPLGHAIVFASGYILSEIEFLKRNDKLVNSIFKLFFIFMFLLLFFIGGDLFSLISGVLFFLLIKRKKWQSLYFYIALCVIFIELVGTYNGAWEWKPLLYGLIKTLNPPVGAVFFYAGGDVLLVKLVQLYDKIHINYSIKNK